MSKPNVKPVVGVFSTEDFSIFGQHETNRNINPFTLKRIMESMRRYGFLRQWPIHCVMIDGKMVVKDGHHRLEAARRLGIPVLYICADDGGISLYELNRSAKQWTNADYANHYMREGSEEYVKLMELCESTGFPLAATVSMLIGQLPGSGNRAEQFKAGHFTTTAAGLRSFEIVAELSASAKEGGFEHATAINFIKALWKVHLVKEVLHDEMCRRLRTYGHTLQRRSQVDDYLEDLEKAYNRNTSFARVPVKFLANEASRMRSVTEVKRKERESKVANSAQAKLDMPKATVATKASQRHVVSGVSATA